MNAHRKASIAVAATVVATVLTITVALKLGGRLGGEVRDWVQGEPTADNYGGSR